MAAATKMFGQGGVGEQLFATHILSFLSADDLVRAAQVNHFFRDASAVSHLWTNLLDDDFTLPFQESTTPSSSVPEAEDTEQLLPAKERYARRLQERNERYQHAKEAALRSTLERQRIYRVRMVQSFLDVTQFKLLIPLPIVALFLSIVLTCLHFDGFNISIWACAGPLLFCLLYILLSAAVACCVYQQQGNSASVFGGLWQDMRGPIKAVYMETLRETPRLAGVAVAVLILCATQVVLVALKLYLKEGQGMPTDGLYFSWAAVFLPLWVLLLLYCLAPAVGCFRDIGAFVSGVVFVWVPFVVLFVCLAVKLDAQDKGQDTHLRLALIFTPFWVIEGVAMLSSLGYMLLGFHYYRMGFLDSFCEYVGVFASTWLLVAPFVIFQALLCVRDDAPTNAITASDAVAPLLIVLGWFLLSSVAFALTFRTPFHEMRELSRREVDAGQAILFDV